MMRRGWQQAFFAGVMLANAMAARAVDPVAGPMVGHVTDRSARVWMQWPVAGDVTLVTYDMETSQPVSSVRVGLDSGTPFVSDMPINGLRPNRSYRIEVKFDNEAVKLAEPPLVIRSAPPPGEQVVMTVAFGSGLGIAPMTELATRPAAPARGAATGRAGEIGAIFREITALKPRAFFFLGNTGQMPATLAEFPVQRRAAFRMIGDFHAWIRKEPELQALLRTTPAYSIFGERDFGPVQSDKDFVFAPESLAAFGRFWPNPDWGTPEHPGCYFSMSLGDVDFFMLDTRTYRKEPTGAMLGAAQMEWLKKGLQNSKASFKIIGAPCMLWGDAAQPGVDSWSKFGEEQAGFLAWLAERRIEGVIALAGNQEAGMIKRFDFKPAAGGGHYPLFTAAVSTLGGPVNGGPGAGEESFGTLDFGGLRERRFVTIRVRDAVGKMKAEQILFATQLRN